MNIDEHNGRLRLTWGQITWGIAVLITLVSSWFRIELRLSALEAAMAQNQQLLRDGVYTKAAVDEMKREADRVHDELRREIEGRRDGPERDR